MQTLAEGHSLHSPALLTLPYLRARLARGCFHIFVYALRKHCSTLKMLLYAWLTALLDPQTHCILHCAGIAQGLEVTKYVALSR